MDDETKSAAKVLCLDDIGVDEYCMLCLCAGSKNAASVVLVAVKMVTLMMMMEIIR